MTRCWLAPKRKRYYSATWLKSHGYDGLWNPEEPCGCKLDDLNTCGEKGFCRPGYLSHCECCQLWFITCTKGEKIECACVEGHDNGI